MKRLDEDFFEEDELEIDFKELEDIENIATSDNQSAKTFRFHVGMRNIKTALAATLCAFLYALFNRNPTFACIGAIFGMGSDLKNSKLSGGNRLFGTIVGGLIGMVLFYIYIKIFPEPESITFFLFILLFIGIICLVLICQLLVIPGAIQPAGVVLCIILFNTPVDQFIIYPLNRIFDTAIGVTIGIMVNMLISRERIEKLKQFLNMKEKKN